MELAAPLPRGLSGKGLQTSWMKEKMQIPGSAVVSIRLGFELPV
jgi:hypothetical protein